MQQLMQELQTSQQVSSEKLQMMQEKAMQQNQQAAATAAENANKALIDSMSAMLKNIQQPQTQPNPQRSESTDKDKEDRLDKKSDIKLNEKSYKRMDKFSGGDDEWQDWRYDFEIITRSVNPDVGIALTEICKNTEPKTAAEIYNDDDMINQPWRPKLR